MTDGGPATSDAHADAQPPAEAGADGGNSGQIAAGTLKAKTWTWIPVDGNLCRDGSATGIGVNLAPRPTSS